jgi:gliding motility-associated lipoprotein GldD
MVDYSKNKSSKVRSPFRPFSTIHHPPNKKSPSKHYIVASFLYICPANMKFTVLSPRLLLLFVVTTCLWAACEEYPAVPKPRAYPRVVYPTKAYQPFDANYCRFTFDMPAYAKLERDTTFFEGKPGSDCWFNLTIPALSATIHCSYYPVTNRKRFDELLQDAFVMAQKHNVRASYIEEIPVSRPADRVHGMIFNIEGPAASSYQFYLTDSTRHFLRGALYFNTKTKPDSLAPVMAFVKRDIDKLAETLKWR